ncbi:hypothetical protein [Microbacterium sp. SORGH_AS_0888]|uniref:hypothetical protein n=1 Tax=Microbacterium sp. SORGH_AS_0888 TaxID=3041791 RepID=UPI00278514FE|nr:hypothetical protein [Microbacterium sp. SORGH_AS_0888]MDQ1128452.1 hypothetical protein [Microbacterium sp. SORGH_AS_0888]
MVDRRYDFCSVWQVTAAPEACWQEVVTAFQQGRARWWPGVRIDEAPAVLRTGESFVLAVRAPLGYRLRMRMRIDRLDPARCLAVSAVGDLRGSGELSLAGTAEGTALTFDWNVVTTRRWMTASAWALRPVFAAGHRAVMRRGEKAFRRRLRSAD